jgi:branched-chain amino acid transport system substrate-binding protein
MKLLALVPMLAIVLVAGCIGQQPTTSEQAEEPLKIGVIAPLSGGAAIWGESTREGMELAREELAAEGVNITIIYEDSEANAAKGLAAYSKLRDIDNVDLVFSEFSRVSVPLVSLADADKKPLIMTLVSADGVTEKSNYTFRFFTTARQVVDPHFEERVSKDKYESIAILHLSDEFGESVAKWIRQRAAERAIEIVADEKFDPNALDFRTQLTKIKDRAPKALLFVPATPTESAGIVKQARELQLATDLFEASSVLSIKSARDAAGEGIEGVYTNAYPFTLELTGGDFRAKYIERYSKDPLSPAGFGYDVVQLIAKASGGKRMGGQQLVQSIKALNTFQSIMGNITIQPNGEINPDIHSVRIVNGTLVL